jgi:hypothetical protein
MFKSPDQVRKIPFPVETKTEPPKIPTRTTRRPKRSIWEILYPERRGK